MLRVNIEKKMSDFTLKVSFCCDNAKLLALTGPSGAGKTTLIRILAGLEKADIGKISYNGKVWFDSNNNILLSPQAREVGYVFQEHTLFPHMSIAENISFIAKDQQQALNLLHRFHISHIARRKPHQVSGGERQRAALAQALARQPKVLFLDEPFSALDPTTRTKLQNELTNIKKSYAMPIVHVTHDLDEAKLLADNTLYIKRTFDKEADHSPPVTVSSKASFMPNITAISKAMYFCRLPLKVPTGSSQ